jgi:hypothetical protein
MQAVHRIHDDDTTSNFEVAITVKSYDTTNSDDHRKEQFANLQHYYNNKLPLNNFQWHVKNILKKQKYEGEIYYLVRFLNTNMNATTHNYEYPLE